MNPGLDISIDQFAKLPTKEQNVILYQNVQEIKCIMKSYRIRQWMQWGLIALIGTGTSYLFTLHIK